MKKYHFIWLISLLVLLFGAVGYGIWDYTNRDHETGFMDNIHIQKTQVIESSSYEKFSADVVELIKKYDKEKFTKAVLDEPYYSKRLIVKGESADLDLTEYGAAVVIQGPEKLYVMQFITQEDAQITCEQLQNVPDIKYCEPDIYAGALEDSTKTETMSWGVHQIGADVYAEKLRDETDVSVTVAVVDSGVYQHPFLEGRITDNGKDFVDGDDDPEDKNSHGTHVAGTIVDCTPGLNVKIMPIRVLGEHGYGSMLQVTMGVQYAAYNGAQVINLSLGGESCNMLDDMIKYAVGKGCVVVAAAGNDNQDTVKYSPAHLEECIVVSAVDENNEKAEFSNWGESVDVAAPGVNITSCVPKILWGYIIGAGKEGMSGTSMATPHISAIVAMVRLENPSLTVEEAENKLYGQCRDLGEKGKDQKYGWGIPDYTAVTVSENEPDNEEDQTKPEEDIVAGFLKGIAGKYYAILPVGENGGDVIIVTDDPTKGGETVTAPSFTPDQRGYNIDIYTINGSQISYAGTKEGRISNGPWFVYQNKITSYDPREGYNYLDIAGNQYTEVHVSSFPEDFQDNQEVITLIRA